MRLVDADELVKKWEEMLPIMVPDEDGKHPVSLEKAIEKLKDAPTIDAVPVVRCDKCIMHNNCFTEDAFNLCCIENPFCCAGKRMEPQKPPEAVEEDDFFMKRFMRME